MRRFICSMLGTAALIASGCSHAMYSAANIPREYVAPHHVSARHVDLSSMSRTAIPAEWLQPGDSVEVSIATGVETGPVPKYELMVDNHGRVDVPLVGFTAVAGLTPSAAAEQIRDESVRQGIYVDPKVTVSIKKRRTFQVSVVGAVNQPDTYEIPAANCDLLTAITMAKGVSDEASRFIEIRHSPTTLQALASTAPPVGLDGVSLASYQSAPPAPIVSLDLAELQSISPNSMQLYDGSVVNVTRERKRVVNVIGLVARPSQIEMPDGEDLSLLSAIAQAGGTTLSIADKVHVIRTVGSGDQPVVIEASLSAARSGGPDNLRLARGDIVSVEETPTTIAVQTVRSFFRVGFSAAVPGI